MTYIYETEMTCTCPVDGSKDRYLVTLQSDVMIQVETLLKELKQFENMEDFQEGVTDALASKFNCRVTTIGMHSGVKTTVISG